MPFYEYECQNCKFYTELLQKVSDPPLTKCPSCGKNRMKKLISAPVFRLKGGGWYETDFKSDKENKRNLAVEKDSDASPAADSKTADTKAADAKPADSKAADAKSSTAAAPSEAKGSGSSAGESSRGRSKASAGRSASARARPAVKAKAKRAPARAKKRR